MKAPAISGPVQRNLTQALREVMRRVLPWVPFLVLLAWGWPVDDVFHAVPSYQDALEVLWGIEWYGAHFPDRDLLFYPLLFHPEGWHVATFAYGPAVFLPLLPLFRWGGAAFAYNAGALLSLFVAFAGMFRLARHGGGAPLHLLGLPLAPDLRSSQHPLWLDVVALDGLVVRPGLPRGPSALGILRLDGGIVGDDRRL